MYETDVLDEIEIVDLEEYACSGKPLPKHVKYYLIKIDDEKFRVQSPITAKEIMLIADLNPDDYRLEQIFRDKHVIPLNLDQLVDLREAGVERFVSVLDQSVSIIVNARQKQVCQSRLSFGDLVRLAFSNPPTGNNVCFTITFENGPRKKPEGSLVEGNTIKVKTGMIFDVTATDKS